MPSKLFEAYRRIQHHYILGSSIPLCTMEHFGNDSSIHVDKTFCRNLNNSFTILNSQLTKIIKERELNRKCQHFFPIVLSMGSCSGNLKHCGTNW